MDDGNAKAKRYRKNAKDVRHISHDVRGDRERQKLLAIANKLEKLADALETKISN